MRKPYIKALRIFGAIWGISGITLILASAVTRIWPHMIDALNGRLTLAQWLVLVSWCAFMLVAEGYRGFQKQFSPRVVARAGHLLNLGRPIDLILAPLYCVGYFHATMRRIITSWSLTTGIILLIVAVHYLTQPWRGIIDSGVVLGLLYGLIWIYIYLVRAFKRNYVVKQVIPKGDTA